MRSPISRLIALAAACLAYTCASADPGFFASPAAKAGTTCSAAIGWRPGAPVADLAWVPSNTLQCFHERTSAADAYVRANGAATPLPKADSLGPGVSPAYVVCIVSLTWTQGAPQAFTANLVATMGDRNGAAVAGVSCTSEAAAAVAAMRDWWLTYPTPDAWAPVVRPPANDFLQ